MDHQTWFERFKSKMRYEDDRQYNHFWVEERWKIVQYASVMMAIHQLPSVERRIISAVFFSGLSEREISKKMKIPKTKVHRFKMKALKLLEGSIYVKLALSPWRLNRIQQVEGGPVQNA